MVRKTLTTAPLKEGKKSLASAGSHVTPAQGSGGV